jgi:Sec-independent protein translocase protein TatA
MISTVILLLVLGLLVFGPKKTIEMVQNTAQALAQIKLAATEHHSSLKPTVATDREGPEHQKSGSERSGNQPNQAVQQKQENSNGPPKGPQSEQEKHDRDKKTQAQA